jgi:SAM-dependent methyltransferase
MNVEAVCPSCGNRALKRFGRLPDAYHFCDREFAEPVNQGNLYGCKDCGLWFRYPCLGEADLSGLYSEAKEHLWSCRGNEKPKEWTLIREKINALAGDGGKILDVGCFRGDFLNFLEGRWEKYGIEPSLHAARVAQSVGVNIIGKSVDQLDKSGMFFDVIVMLDVIEHIPNPFKAISVAADHLTPGGLIIILTGRTDCLLWRLFRNLYYYAAMPEHVSFLSPRYVKYLADSLKLVVVSMDTTCRWQQCSSFTSFLKRMGLSAANLLFHPLRERSLFKRAIVHSPMMRRIMSRGIYPVMSGYKDHFLIVFRKI